MRVHRGVGSSPQLGEGKYVSISVCTESLTHQKENVPTINWSDYCKGQYQYIHVI